MYYDLLVHVDLADEQRFALALGNIGNYLAALPDEQYTVVVLANGGAASCLARKDNPQAETVRTLAAKGVSFRVCVNALKKVGLTQDELLDNVTVVPAGVVEVVRLQREGYAYIKP